MPVSNWLRSMFGRVRTGTIRNVPKPTASSRLGVEGLEDRVVPAVAILAAAPVLGYASDVEAQLVSTGLFTAAEVDVISVGGVGAIQTPV